tara:strand:- start:6185 stop:6475 length:291 start_codon:yes stop_codon:yes gene_type:complete
MANSQTNLTWIEVDVSTMDEALTKAYNKMLDDGKKARESKAGFQTRFINKSIKVGSLDTGYSLAFAYKWGKLSVAKVSEAEKSTRVSAKPKVMFKF